MMNTPEERANWSSHLPTLELKKKSVLFWKFQLLTSKPGYLIQNYSSACKPLKANGLTNFVRHGQYDLVKPWPIVLCELLMVRRTGVEFDKNDVTDAVGALWRRGISHWRAKAGACVAAWRVSLWSKRGKIITDTVKELLTRWQSSRCCRGAGLNGKQNHGS